MTDLCFICNKLLSEGETVNVVRGLKTLKTASISRNDGHIEYLNTVTSVNVHVDCRKVYISKHSITASKRRHEDEEPSTSSDERKKRTDIFDFKTLCMFCSEAADEVAEMKKEGKYKRTISRVSTIEFKKTIMKRADERGDLLGKLVKDRIIFEHDLIAAEAKYHSICHVNFLRQTRLLATDEVPRRDDKIIAAMQEIFCYIENNEDSQFTLKELRDVITGYVPNDRTIILKLRERYLTNIIITTKIGSFTIISFRDTQANILSSAWYNNKKGTVEEERMRVVETAAAIIREDIRSSVVETKSYPPPSKMMDDINREIPRTLLHFLEEVIVKNKKTKRDHLQTKCTAISHAIMASMRERSFSSQLLLGLSVFLHRRYGSKRLLDVLSSFGFSASYNDTVKYEVSAVLHPQPRILPSETGVLVQYVGDNADINVNTLDGNNTFHVMGMIKIITPKNAVIYDERIKKCTTTPSAKELAAVSHVPLLTYEKHAIPGLSRIEVKNLNDEDVLTEYSFNTVDFLWMYGKWRNISPLPGWNGFIEELTKNNKNFQTSQIMFLPFIDQPASNMNTIYTTLQCAINIAKTHGQKTCIITFDQPLYIKAREIVAASDANSDLSQVIVRLGGFHMLMCFLGSIGYIMDGSGIKEALSQIYAANSVDKMLDGHAYSRSIRGHTLLRLALSKVIFEDMEIENDNVLDELIEQMMSHEVTYENLEGCANNCQLIINQYVDKFNELKARGPTAQLWLQYFHMVSIALDFIRAERLGLFEEHLNAVKKMLPYFHASGRFLYAKSTHLYLQDMITLRDTMDQQNFENFKNGFFTVKRTDKFNSGTWTDMIIEQSLMKSMKTEGGVSRGRSTQDSVLSKWVYSMYATSTICDEIEKLCNISLDSVDQHVDSRDSRIKRDNTDVSKLVEWFTLHNPFPNIRQVVSIASGIVGNDTINCHKASTIGLESMEKITGLTFNDIKLKRADKVVPLSTVNRSIKVNNCKVAIDPLLLFQRITVNKKFDHHLEKYLQYELSPYPTSLFDNAGMRKSPKAKLFNIMEPVDIELNQNNVTYIIDGGFLLHRVVWNKNDTFSVIVNKYINYLQNHFGSNVVVVFDGYADYSKNIKAMEQLRRTAAFSTSYEVRFDATMIVPTSQEKFLSNRNNKKNFIEMLIEQLKIINIATKQARDDADVLIVETAIAISEQQKTAVIVGEDIDLLVILIGRTKLYQREIFVKKIGKGNIETRMYSSKSLDKYPRCKEHILFLHAFTGCDTTSSLFNKGKLQIIKIFEKHPDLCQSAQLFRQENCPPDILYNNGVRVLLAMYNAPKTELNIDNLRYLQFIKSTRLNRPVQLSSLPPTSAAAQQHIYRVYYQTQTWLGKDLSPEEWGWFLEYDILLPTTTLLPPAPEELLSIIFCNCKKGCGANCGCRKVGLQCSAVCGQCNGQACLNAPSTSNNIDEEIEYMPQEIFDLLETNITDTEDCDNDLLIDFEDQDEEDNDE